MAVQNWQDGIPSHGQHVDLFRGQKVKVTGSQSVKALLLLLVTREDTGTATLNSHAVPSVRRSGELQFS